MSERSFSGTARANPLYGGANNPSARSGAPAWANSSNVPRNTTYSEAASSPPDSPGRGAHYYEPQYDDGVYHVQTPGPGYEQQHHPSSYYVQTPAPSEMHRAGGGEHSPFSSAPPSPSQSLGAGTTPFDARSSRSRTSLRAPGSAPPPIKKIDEEEADEEEALRPDPAMVAAKRKRFYKCLTGWCCLLWMVGLVAAAVTLWFVYQPKPPSYTYDGMTINNFTTFAGYDANGLPTRLLYMDMYANWGVKNRNQHYSAYFNGGLAQCGYSSLPVVAQSGFTRRMWLAGGQKANVSSHFTASGFPLYNVGTLFYKDMEVGVAQIEVKAQMVTYVPVLWKLVQPRFTTGASCMVNFDPRYLLFINATCTWS